MTDLGIVQNPMFGTGSPRWWASLLPGYGPARAMTDAAFAPGFHAGGELFIGLAWTVILAVLVTAILSRAVRPRG